jgi:hypothetical protein
MSEEYGVPIDNKGKRKSESFLPRYFRTDTNKKFLSGTLDPLIQNGTARRLNGFIGRKNSKASKGDDIFLKEITEDRNNYQLEPCLMAEDTLGNTSFFKDYIDYINSISVLGGLTENHQRLNKQEFYSWDPHIDWDKFVNYLQYYWLPYGPETIPIRGQKTLDTTSTYNIQVVDEGDNFAYLFTPDALTRNPDLRLYRGQTYRFEINSPDHPFAVKTAKVSSATPKFRGSTTFNYAQHGKNNFSLDILTDNDIIDNFLVEVYIDGNKIPQDKFTTYINANRKKVLQLEKDITLGQVVVVDFFIKRINDEYRYLDGIKTFEYVNGVLKETKNFNVKHGILEFTVGTRTPDILYYVSENDANTSGIFKIFDIDENSIINVDEEIIGKKDFVSNGLKLSNGMKIRFRGLVFPEYYRDKDFYVEGVGEGISLIDETTLEVVNDIAYNVDVNFDVTGFDELAFNNIKYAALDKDYIVINRSSKDRNSWSRYNRWFHKDIIETTAKVLGKTPVFDQDKRALRPIIEFKPNIRLFNFGNRSKPNIDLVDDFTTDVFSIIEGSPGYNVDGVPLLTGHRVLFTGDNDIYVKNKIFKVEFIDLYDEKTGITKRVIHLNREQDSDPEQDQTVLILSGTQYTGKMMWFDGNSWTLGQNKTQINQQPLFELFDDEHIKLTDNSKYDSSTFKGTKLFSYKVGTGTIDKELGFPLTYRNINNIGDIVFDFNLINDTFKYKIDITVIDDIIANKYLEFYTINQTKALINGWTVNHIDIVQPIVRIYKNEYYSKNGQQVLKVNDFSLDVYDDYNNLEDLKIKVFVNGERLLDSDIKEIYNGVLYKQVVLKNDIVENDIVTIKCYSKRAKNSNGHYDFPINFQNNPLNYNLQSFTLGEVIDHVDSIIDNIQNFDGVYPGPCNLRDIGSLSNYGTKFVQHSGSLNLPLYHFTDKKANIFKALEMSMNDYNKFKRSFIFNSQYLEEGMSVKNATDLLLQNLNLSKTKSMPYYFSDMLAYSGHVHTQFKIKEFVQQSFPLSKIFNLKKLSTQATYIYVNQNQLLHERDYVFTDDGFINVLVKLTENDIVDLYEYDSTDGCFVPPTPTSLGLYPKYEPRKYLDTTLLEPQHVIQGHDGSIVLAFNDFRDDLILEIEKRIFNNIKVEYDPKVFDLYDFIPGSNRKTDYTLDEFNKLLGPNFFQWTRLIDQDYTKTQIYLKSNPFTYNYSEVQSFDFTTLPGFWRGIYRWYYDTDRIHICPWESLGFTIKPKWWDNVYGPAPYTSDNLILWQDLAEGRIRYPDKPVIVAKFVKPVLENIPTNAGGGLLNPIEASLATGLFNARTEKNYVFGDVSPVENAWRRSSYYPFAILRTLLLMNPTRMFGLCFDRSRIIKNPCDQYVYKETGLHLKLKDLVITSTPKDTKRIQTAGLVNYIVDYLISDKNIAYENYKDILTKLTNKLSHRLSGFSSKDKFNLILDSRSVNSKSGVFIPQENYKIFLNTSSPTKKLFYSGVIITKLLTRYGLGYEIKGYSQAEPYFKYYLYNQPGYEINVGGISESFINWEVNQKYIAGNILKIGEFYYRVKISHTSSTNVDYTLLQKLPALPVVGGINANIRTSFDPLVQTLNYGTVLFSIQEVVDFILGYDAYLKDQGFVFDTFLQDLNSIANWETSVKEFLFWNTQNWGAGKETYVEWEPQTLFQENDIVMYNNEFYRSRSRHVTSTIFDPTEYTFLDSIDTEGASAISLSPGAINVELKLNYNVVEDINSTIEYEIFKSDGTKYNPKDLNYFRDNGIFNVKPKNSDDGIYGVGVYLIQKEHVLVIDNVTQFNDIIYNISTGYRQDRIKIYGYKSINWEGGFESPGFIYDEAYVQDWTPYVDYNIGDIVKYKEFYYTATKKIPGDQNFVNSEWERLNEVPTSKLLPNWDYKALQFTDFYDLDSDNFDSGQQKIAQHLIGYQKRSYLRNIIKNDVSEFKFYQGMITEKGTVNSLTKLFDILGPDNEESLEFIEEWAVRVGRFGSSEAFDEIEFIIDEDQFKIEPQPYELIDKVDNAATDLVVRVTKNDLFLKPKYYDKNIWPKENDYNPLLKTPGFCKIEFAKAVLNDLDDILVEQQTNLININDFEVGDYIWCGFQTKINRFKDDWFIYRFTELEVSVTQIPDIVGTNLILTYNILGDIQTGDLIGFKSNYDKLTGFFKVIDINTVFKKITIVKPTTFVLNNLTFSTIKTFVFADQRYLNIDEFSVPRYINPTTNLKPFGELVWFTENNVNTIWRNMPVYSSTSIVNDRQQNNSEFGHRVAVNKDATVMAITHKNNELFKGIWNAATTYTKDDVVYRDGLFWRCIKETSNHTSFRPNIDLSSVQIEESPELTATFSCTSVNYIESGSQIRVAGILDSSFGSNGNIVGYSSPSIYKVIAGSVNTVRKFFRLSQLDDTALITSDGDTIGLQFTLLGDFIPVTDSARQIIVYYKPYLSDQWIKKQGIQAPNEVYNFGDSITISDDGRFIAITGIKKTMSNIEKAVYVYSIPQKTLVFTSEFNTIAENKIDYANNTFIIPNHLLINGTIVTYSTQDQVINGLTNNEEYYVKVLSPNSFSLTTDVEQDKIVTLYKSETGTHFFANLFANNDYVLGPVFTNNVQDIDYGKKLKFSLNLNSNPSLSIYKLYISSTNKALDVYSCSNNIWSNAVELALPPSTVTYANDFDVSADGSRIVIADYTVSKVYIYNNTYNIIQTLISTDNFGYSVSISSNTKYIAVGSILTDDEKTNQGQVNVYKLENNSYTIYQTIKNKNPANDDNFGYWLKFSNDDIQGDPKTLTVVSKQGTQRVDIFDRYQSNFIFSETLNTGSINVENIDVGENFIIIGNENYNVLSRKIGEILTYNKKSGSYSWSQYIKEQDKVNLNRIKKVFVYNRKTNNLISYLDVIDPVYGKISGVIEQELKFKTYYDPATYSVKSNSLTANITIDEGMAWTDKHVGMLWWDLRKAKFLDSSIGDTSYNSGVFNSLFPTASIDVYEWVQSSVLPADWDVLADTAEGFPLGISGKTLYGNNAYSVKLTYDSLGKRYKSTYYFWVKNKRIVPNAFDRKYSASDIASAISNPQNFNLKYIQFLGTNSFGLVNLRSILDKRDLVLSVQYWTSDPTNLNMHSEWRIISDNEKTTIPTQIERRWFDSLIGFDSIGRPLPSLSLPPKLRYGIESIPNQSMFVNRLEVLKQLIERLNFELADIQIDNIDLAELYLKDEIPQSNVGYYDYIKDVTAELRFIQTQNFRQATLDFIIENGQIIEIDVIDGGYGYQIAPNIIIQGDGEQASAKTIINNAGVITSVTILDKGKGYNKEFTTIQVRPLSALILSALNGLNQWAIYHYINNNWLKVKTQKYNVSNYWNFIDWYADGYNQFTRIDYTVNGVNEALNLNCSVGQIVKVKNISGTNNWLLLEKFTDTLNIDYTKVFKVVGRQNGALQISDNFYNFKANQKGYDGMLYDSDYFDSVGTTELRIILNALKNKILIDNRRKIYINLFFISLKYVLFEQPFVDWLFKTSFVKVLHHVGPLRQKVTFNNDGLEDYESYIKEVKPFRTKIREFVSIYDKLDSSQSLITDFDLPAYVNSNNNLITLYTQYQDNNVYVNNNQIVNKYPYKAWKDGLGYYVKEIVIIDGGAGYIDYPNVEVLGDCIRPAQVKVFVSKGSIAKIDILDPGEGYFVAPTIKIEGKFTENGYEGRAFAVLGNGLVRSNLIGMKFDRYSKENIANLVPLIAIDTFTGDAIKTTFDLTYTPSFEKGTYTVKLNNAEIFFTEYTLERHVGFDKAYRYNYGKLIFKNAPKAGVNIRIEYVRNFNSLNSLERIKYFYEPKSGMLGKDFAQLMNGIDYAGVVVTGIGFGKTNLWDGEFDWGERLWDSGELTDDEQYDTLIEGGNLVSNLNRNITPFRTATGLRADDIIIDGDGFITPTTSPAPEEMLPGHVSDTVVIKVTERSLNNSSKISCKKFITDGIETNFTIDDYPNNEKAIIVKLGEDIIEPSQYDFDYKTLTIKFKIAPVANKELAVISLGFSGYNLLSTDHVVVTDKTYDVVTDVDWRDGIKGFTVVSGKITESTIFRTYGLWNNEIQYKLNDFAVYANVLYRSVKSNNVDNTPTILDTVTNTFVVDGEYWQEIEKNVTSYNNFNKVGLRFASELDINDIVSYSIFLDTDIKQSVVTKETVISNGLSRSYLLTNFVGYDFPLGANTIVRIGDTLLNSVDTLRLTLKNRVLKYTLNVSKTNIDIYSYSDYEVFIDNVKVPNAIAYAINLSDSTITFKPNYYRENAEVLITITKFADYTITSNEVQSTITFKNVYPVGTEIEIMAMTNHDILDINRTYEQIDPKLGSYINTIYYPTLVEITGGIIYLDKEVYDTNHVWVTKNKKLLTPYTDYVLRESKKSIQLTVQPIPSDKFSVITFSQNIVRPNISYLHFKDMLNYTSYKRLSQNRTTKLARDLLQSDKEIIIDDAAKITNANSINNVAGVIYINGERIEYFSKVGSILSQLRRGTLGTGVPLIHKKGTDIYDIGSNETIPYNDETLIYNWKGDWNNYSRYLINDVVNYNNVNWINLTSNNFSEWNSTVVYRLNQQVIYLNDLYIAVKEVDGAIKNINQNPGDSDTSWWKLLTVNFTVYPSDNNPNWARTEFAYLEDSSNTLVVPWTPITRSNSVSTNFDKEVLDIEVYVGTQRLKKTAYSIHNKLVSPHSPEGDDNYPADFITNAQKLPSKNAYEIRLSEEVPVNTTLTVVRKHGKLWNDKGKMLNDSTNKIVDFLQTEANLIEGTSPNFDSGLYTSDSDDLRMDED